MKYVLHIRNSNESLATIDFEANLIDPNDNDIMREAINIGALDVDDLGKVTHIDYPKEMPKKKRLGRVEFNIGYVVDLDDENMIDHAKESIYEDILSAFKNGCNLNIDTHGHKFSENDIPEFLIETDEN